MMEIRDSLPSDLEHIEKLHLDAFDSEESKEVSKLAAELAAETSVISLVAVENKEIIGHVVFSPVSISDYQSILAFILSPLAVSRSKQNQGIGSRLIKFGLDRLSNQGIDAVFVLGDPGYYSRSGFHTRHRIRPPYFLPCPEAWQALELNEGVLRGVAGVMSCMPALMSPDLW